MSYYAAAYGAAARIVIVVRISEISRYISRCRRTLHYDGKIVDNTAFIVVQFVYRCIERYITAVESSYDLAYYGVVIALSFRR